ncbi:tumor necrosis factor receptor superfamily member wengen [Phlebotomus argentipes]|uniref:tumor necrosis factor receptor superfamily member wengen n=1 Tax=Phlebotomus argentipes TaxID=94469 RepID=UPI0028937074|nr:tumor necrosis factor receptor superfamily member wengen [Phlebotomus argentipes]
MLSTWRITNIRYSVFLAVGCHILTAAAATGPCEKGSWWHSAENRCIVCTQCEEATLRMCQPHTDTVCGTFQDLGIDSHVLSRIDPRHEAPHEPYSGSSTDDDLEEWNWQATFLAMAAVACLLFFFAAAIITLQHARQWRMERKFDADMEEMSARLMAKLAQVQSLENRTIFIEEPSLERIGKPLEVHCVYLEQLLAGKNFKKYPGKGNVYIEENTSK